MYLDSGKLQSNFINKFQFYVVSVICTLWLLQGLFGIPELRDPSGFYLLQNYAEQEVESFVEEAFSPNRKRKMVQIFDDMSDSLCKVADMVRGYYQFLQVTPINPV